MLPTLFKLTSKKEIQYWKAWVVDNPPHFPAGVYLCTEYGLLNTSSPQITSDLFTTGKNIGKSNQSSPYQQAVSEATSKWEKKLKSGYVQSIEAAKGGLVDDLIEGGVLPMLAFEYSKQGHKIKFPCYTQPKSDGIRAVCIIKDGKATLWSRTRKPITSCPHIIDEVEHCLPDGIYDGELYNHFFKDNFEHIVHLVKQVTPCEGHEDVQYHIYDLIDSGTFKERYEKLQNNLYGVIGEPNSSIRLVDTHVAETEADISDLYSFSMALGYEGLMLRNADGLYVNKRSYDLIKMKEMQDAEFSIVGINEGRGRLQGHVGSFVCVTESGAEFSCKLAGETSKLKEYFEDHSLWQGKKMTISYQNLTNPEGIPRFPIGKSIRDYE